jgi:hypothetical protein
VRASLLDEYVEQQVLAALSAEGGLLAQAVEASEAVDEAARTVADAEHELDLFVNNPTLLTVLGEEKFVEGVEVRQRALDEARAGLAQLRSHSDLATELGDGDLLTAWPSLTIQERRRLMHGLLERVVLTRAEERGRAAEPISERTEIVLRGGAILAVPQNKALPDAGSSGKRTATTARGRTQKTRKAGRTRTRSASS